jgi:cystathionine beta-lyase/cystathionine gamma-synthase
MPAERDRSYRFATRMIHAGETPDPTTGARGVPIHQSATYAFDSYDQIRQWEDGEFPHFQYSREANPTVQKLEAKLANLEGAEASVAVSSGMGAISSLLLEYGSNGGHVIGSSQLYGSSGDLLDRDLPSFGADVTRLDFTDIDAVEAAIQPNTRLIFAETFSNPTLRVADVPALADIAHRHGALLAIDNTFLSPALYRPIEDGADLVLHSATKYLSGSGQAIGGIISGSTEQIASLRDRIVRLGTNMAPFTAWLIINGCKTLSFRVERHSSTAQRLAEQLAAHPAVKSVMYPGLPTHPGHDVAMKLTGGPCSGLLSFELHGDPGSTRSFIDSLELCTIAVSLGEATTLIWPYREGTIRLAVGLEDPDDLSADLAAGLAAAAATLDHASIAV